MGAITECYRANVASHRSAHPLEPVAAFGPRAEEYLITSYRFLLWYQQSMASLENDGQILYAEPP